MSLSKHDTHILNAILNPGGVQYQDIDEPQITNDEDEYSEENQAARELELNAVTAANNDNLNEAINLLTKAINISPKCASCYNNRAQALRLKGDLKGAKEDLDKAIALSSGCTKAACQAYTQRAIIKRYEGFEDEAMVDFKLAAHLGGTYAKEMCVALNPYAALCSNMLASVFQKIREGEA